MTGLRRNRKLDGIEDGAQVNDGYSQAESDGRYLRIDAGAPDQTRVSGEATFAELTTHASGVEVTGGTYSGNPGIFSAGNGNLQIHSANRSLGIYRENTKLIDIANIGSSSTSAVNVAYSSYFDLPNADSQIIGFNVDGDNTNLSALKDAVGYNFFFPRSDRNAANDPSEEIVGFKASPKTLENELDNPAITYYGFKSELNSAQNYNFYAAGSGPNYFAGNIVLNPDSPSYDVASKGIRLDSSGYIGCKRSNPDANKNPCLILTRTNSDSNGNWRIIELSNHDGTDRSFIKIDGGHTRVVDSRLSPTSTDFPSASNIIKLLQPKVITQGGQTFNGFLPSDLTSVYDDAVDGDENATEPIGTVTDYDGTELETNVTEPDELTYEEQVEVTPYVEADPDNGVEEQEATYTTVTRTKTWTATGTQPVYQGVDQTKLIPLLTKALQEALDRIETLEAQINP